MNDTCGPTSPSLSGSADLQLSLESRLQARMARLGSLEYKLTWKQWAISSLLRICALRASGHRTSGNAFTGWPTPNTPSGGPNVKSTATHTGGMDLEGAATLAGWTTPQTHDAQGLGSADRLLRHGTKHGCKNLQDEVHLAGWSTPNAPRKHDSDLSAYRWNPNKKQDDPVMQLLGRDMKLSDVPMEKRGVLNPEFHPLANGVPARVGKLRAYGNAIVPQVAAEFIKAVMDTIL